MPTEEESTASSLLDTAIADAVSDLEQFDVLDELDLLEQAEEFTVATNTSQGSDAGRKKRGIERKYNLNSAYSILLKICNKSLVLVLIFFSWFS